MNNVAKYIKSKILIIQIILDSYLIHIMNNSSFLLLSLLNLLLFIEYFLIY